MSIFDKTQVVQEEQYRLPYHYIPSHDANGFSQCVSWSWGMKYLGGLEVVLDQLKAVEFSSLIDIGCGDGRFLPEVKSRFPETKLLGVDYSDRAIALANALNPNIEFRVADIASMAMDERFDVATMIEVLEHIKPDQVHAFLSSTSTLLNEKGKLLITVPHINKEVNDKHYQHFSSDSLRSVLEPHFHVQKIIPFDRHSRAISLLTRLLGYSGNNYIITNPWINTLLFNLVLKGCLNEQPESRSGRLLAIATPRD